jgi:hypothetical protein
MTQLAGIAATTISGFERDSENHYISKRTIYRPEPGKCDCIPKTEFLWFYCVSGAVHDRIVPSICLYAKLMHWIWEYSAATFRTANAA